MQITLDNCDYSDIRDVIEDILGLHFSDSQIDEYLVNEPQKILVGKMYAWGIKDSVIADSILDVLSLKFTGMYPNRDRLDEWKSTVRQRAIEQGIFPSTK